MDPARDAFRKDVYDRLEQKDPRRWERLRGCAVKHRVFGEGIVTKVMMPDWSNPVHIAVKFRLQEKTFHLSSFGDHTKFTAENLPAQLAEALENAEQEIAREEGRIAEELQQQDRAAKEAAARRQEQAAARAEQQQRAEAQRESVRVAEVEARLAEIGVKIDQDQPITAEEVRILLDDRRHELLLRYFERLCARAGDHRVILKAAAIGREAKQPEYALRATGLLLEGIDRLPPSARATLLTTRAGAFLDLRRLAEAKECALQAVEFAGKSPHPHTLLKQILAEGERAR